MRTSLFHSLLLLGLAGGCTGSGQLVYRGEVTTPELVEVSPGVQVIADYDEPIFYSDAYYWRNDGGVWYRSRQHTGGWVRFDAAPVQVRSIERPSMYVHYHARAQANVTDHREPMPPPRGPEVRDHREATPPPPPPPPPEVRDHRDEHREIKEERKDIKEERKDVKEERKDIKEERKDVKKEERKEDKDRKHGH